MDNPTVQAGRPRAQTTTLPKITTSHRTNTSISHTHSRSHHFHRPRHGRTSNARNTLSNAVQLQSPFNFESYNPLRLVHGSGGHNTPDSRRGSLPPADGKPQQDTTAGRSSLERTPESTTLPVKPVTESDVAAEKALRAKREGLLSRALDELSQDAHNVTRQLDDTYYSLLERVNNLRSSLSSLQDLASKLQIGREEFGKETKALEKRVSGTVERFGNFEEQEKTVEGLVGRLESSKGRAKELEGRLEKARGRLEVWEEREREGKRRRARQMGMFWAVVAVVVAIGIGIGVWRGVDGRKEVERVINEGWRVVEDGVRGQGRNRSVGIHLEGDGRSGAVRAKEEKEWGRVLDEL